MHLIPAAGQSLGMSLRCLQSCCLSCFMSLKNTTEVEMQFSGWSYFTFRIFWSKTKCHCRIKGTKTSKNSNEYETSLFCPTVHHFSNSVAFFHWRCFLLSLQSLVKEIISGECLAFLPGFRQDDFDFEGGTGPPGPKSISLRSNHKLFHPSVYAEMGRRLIIRGKRAVWPD